MTRYARCALGAFVVLVLALGVLGCEGRWNPFGCICGGGHAWLWDCKGTGDTTTDTDDMPGSGSPYDGTYPPWCDDEDDQGGGGGG